MKIGLFSLVATLFVTSLAWTQAARAASCVNDIDCTAGGTACGTDICNYTQGETCTAAGQGQVGMEGWCSADTDCKCHNLGATCQITYCTFTTPPDAGVAGASGASGATSASGAAATGGSAGTGGATGGAPSSGSSSEPTGSSTKSGCALGETPGRSSPWSLVISGLGVCFVILRRRQS
jgi:hypothetical protein